MKKITPFLWFDGKAEEAMEIAWAGEIVSKLSRLKEKKIRLVATQYRTGSGSDRVESHCSRNSSSQQSQEFLEVGVVERLGNDQVATASCSVIEWLRKRPHRSPCEF